MNGDDRPVQGLDPLSEEEVATVHDSPAASRREQRRTGSPPHTPPPMHVAGGTASDPHIAGSAVRSRSSMGSQHPSVHQDIATRLNTSRRVLFDEDVALLRTFSFLVGALCVSLVLTLPFMRGNIILRSVLWGGALFSIFTSLWIYVVLRDVSRYDQKLINITALLSVLIAYSGVLYLGVHSPAPLVILPGIYFVARSQGGAPAWAMFLTCSFMQALMATLILTGTIVDPGLITAEDSEFHVRVITQVLIQLLYVGTFVLARTGRAGTFNAMTKLIAAQTDAQRKEAAFVEVRADLDRVLGAGGVGHYSGQLLGVYKVGGIIGRGAMGEVYEAAHVETGQLAAAKVLHPHVLAKQSSIERFLREAQAASAMRSPHSVQIMGISDSSSPVPFIIMERLMGFDLAHHLRELRKLPPADIIALVHQVGSVIDIASAKGIVHRDLKPQNLFLAETGQGALWKVLDFGASKLASHSGTLTQGRVIGTPSYMSPQQAKGQDVDGAADRYGLAAIVYRAITGRPPFAGKDLPTTLYNVVYGTPPQPSVLSTVDPAVDLVLAIAMAKEPGQRFPTGQAFALALEGAFQGHIEMAVRRHAEDVLRDNPWGMLPSQKE